MQLQVGMIVCGLAGKERDQYYLIIGQDERYVYLADGRHRRLQKPKRKNPKHVRYAGIQWNPDSLTDKALRQKLSLLKKGE